MARRKQSAPAPKPLDPRLYSPIQCLAAEGKLPADHPAWRSTERDEQRAIRVDALDDIGADMGDQIGIRISDVEYRGRGGTVSECTVCGLFFTSVGPFDEHRVGRIDPHDPAKDTRRCRTPAELRARGMEPNEAGQWRHPRPPDTLPRR